MSLKSCSDRHMGYIQAGTGNKSKHSGGWKALAQSESAGKKGMRIRTSSVPCIRQLEMINALILSSSKVLES